MKIVKFSAITITVLLFILMNVYYNNKINTLNQEKLLYKSSLDSLSTYYSNIEYSPFVSLFDYKIKKGG